MGASDRAQLHDAAPKPPAERLMQVVWEQQRLKRGELKTLDGRSVKILHPGWLNRASGPDFQDAVIQFAGQAPQTGDIEVDVESSGWHSHKHDVNPAYRNVVLHVIWQGGNSPSPLPTLAMSEFLDSPLAELQHWLANDEREGVPKSFQGQCSAPLKLLDEAVWRDVLGQAALIRLQAKAAHIEARARQVGWEQVLIEMLFRALGYKQNVWPMQRLGELSPHVMDAMNGERCPASLQALMFGVSNLLPEDIRDPNRPVDAYVRKLWDIWWHRRHVLHEHILPRDVWRFNGIRPANHPQRRLALAAHWLAKKDLATRLEEWLAQKVRKNQLVPSLLEIMQAERDEFWSCRWTMKAARMTQEQPLLGEIRLTDVSMNVILPWLWLRAAKGQNSELVEEVENRYLSWPRSEDNSVLRQARRRLLGHSTPSILTTAAEQQGLIQIVRDFCDHADSTCADCPFPGLINSVSTGKANEG
ncbi:MAG: hypothetical protein K0Q55_2102 [Verrucomicrobia bacterium]|jgi:hypothetical protein|nr:hypothetical protein [Verrucomicrobiota bacterium]